jgi:uncharacterized MnhB-related membrane protein
MHALQIAVLILVAIAAPLVVRTREPREQAMAVSAYGLVLALMFFLYQAPDVALSQLVIGAVALPLMILLSLAKIQRDEEERR